MNIYATIADVKERLGIAAKTTTYDSLITALLINASRVIDDLCNRHFYSKSATLYFDTTESDFFIQAPVDILSLTSLYVDTRYNGTYDHEIADYRLIPINEYPKTGIEVRNCALPKNKSGIIKAVGVFGYGDGATATPWEQTAVNGTVTTAGGVTLTLSANDVISAGHTIMVDNEQMFVTATGTLSATVQRGINGTAAEAHNAKPIKIAKHPAQIKHAAIVLASRFYRQIGSEEFQSERIRDYSYSRFSSSDVMQIDRYMIAAFRRMRCA